MSRFARSYPYRSRLFWVLALVLAWSAAVGADQPVTSQAQGRTLIAGDPQNPDTYLAYADWLLDQDELQPAAEVLEQGRNKAHASAELLVELGHVYQKQGLVARAEATTREALTIDGDYLPAHLRLGEIYFDLGWPATGLDCFRQAIALAPDESEPRVRLIHGMLKAEQAAAAEEQCLRFLAEHGQDAQLWLALGRVFEKQGKRQQAFTTYGQALVLEPKLAQAYAHQGKLFAEFGQYEAAATACQRALDLDGDNALAHAILGIAAAYLGDEDTARIHAEIAEEAGMNTAAVWRKIGK